MGIGGHGAFNRAARSLGGEQLGNLLDDRLGPEGRNNRWNDLGPQGWHRPWSNMSGVGRLLDKNSISASVVGNGEWRRVWCVLVS